MSADQDKAVRVQVTKVTHKGKTANGNSIYELTTSAGKFRTAANSVAGARLSSRVFHKPVNAVLTVTPRGTVSNFHGSL